VIRIKNIEKKAKMIKNNLKMADTAIVGKFAATE